MSPYLNPIVRSNFFGFISEDLQKVQKKKNYNTPSRFTALFSLMALLMPCPVWLMSYAIQPGWLYDHGL